MKAYSIDLRERVVKAAKEGRPQEEIAKVLAISVSTIKRYLKEWRETTSLEARPIPSQALQEIEGLRGRSEPIACGGP